MDEKQIENLRRLAKSSVSEDGQVRPFTEQMRNYAFGNLPTNEFLIVTDDASKFHLAGVGNEAVLMSQKNIEKVRLDHSITSIVLWTCRRGSRSIHSQWIRYP